MKKYAHDAHTLITKKMPFLAHNYYMTPEEELDALRTWPDDEICKLIAVRTRELRKAGGHTQEALATLADVPLRTFKRFETDGKATLETFIRILRALNRAQYLHVVLNAPAPAKSRFEEKISRAQARWQHPDRK
jgi:DNA-binding XRE family transcriptional regulator